MRVDRRIAANFTASLHQVATCQRTLHSNMGKVFFGILATPIGLPGVGSQVELVHAAWISDRCRFVNPMTCRTVFGVGPGGIDWARLFARVSCNGLRSRQKRATSHSWYGGRWSRRLSGSRLWSQSTRRPIRRLVGPYLGLVDQWDCRNARRLAQGYASGRRAKMGGIGTTEVQTAGRRVPCPSGIDERARCIKEAVTTPSLTKRDRDRDPSRHPYRLIGGPTFAGASPSRILVSSSLLRKATTNQKTSTRS